MTCSEFFRLVENHDWFYQYSDDHRVWQRGQTQWERIQSLGTDPELTPILDAWAAFRNGKTDMRPSIEEITHGNAS